MERSIPMRDGVKLLTSIYIPKDTTEKHPILLSRTPYSCAPYGEQNFANFYSGHLNYFFRENYIMVIQDVRGRWMSEGEFLDVRPFNPNKKNRQDIDEASDTYDTVDWLINNTSDNNGKVGVFGISYPGFYSTMAALSGHPAIKAVSPQAPVTDWFIGDDFHHNGAFFLMDAFAFHIGSGFGKPHRGPTRSFPNGYRFPVKDNYAFYLRTGPLKNFAAIAGDSIRFWNDLYKHPDYDSFWRARNVRNFLRDIKPAVLVVGGLFDAEDCFGAWRTYEAIEQQSKGTDNRLIMGPWYHGQWSSVTNEGSSLGNVRFLSNTAHYYQNEFELPFFNYHLKGKGDLSSIAEATIFFSGVNEWRKFDQWPPVKTQERPLYLQEQGGLSWQKPAGKQGESVYVSNPSSPVPYTEDVHTNRTIEYMTDDQRFASRRPDVLVFMTEPLSEDLTVAGTLKANLFTTISTTDADFVVKLIDVFPEDFSYPANSGPVNYLMPGYQMLIRGEIMRGRYRKSFEKPEAFKPGAIEKVSYELPDVAHTFKKGHRVMVQVQSSWFPLADRNPQQFVNIYRCNEKDFVPSTILILHNASNSSNIILPILNQ